MSLINISQSYRNEIIKGRKALIDEARNHLNDCQAELHKARRAHKRAVINKDWQDILCLRDRISSLQAKEAMLLGQIQNHINQIAHLEENK